MADSPVERKFGQYWGDPWPSGICYKTDEDGVELDPPEFDLSRQHSTPVGEICPTCEEAVQEGDQGTWIGTSEGLVPQHRECGFRAVMGGMAHLTKQCRCYGGKGYEFPGTKREEALAVWRMRRLQ